MGTINAYTLECVTYQKTSDGQLMFFGNDNAGIMNCGIAIYYFGVTQFTTYSPWVVSSDAAVTVSPIERKNMYWAVTRTPGTNGLTAYQNTVNKTSVNCIENLPPLNYCFIRRQPDGGYAFYGVIYAIRIYNRVLAKHEREYNYAVDKMKYPGLK